MASEGSTVTLGAAASSIMGQVSSQTAQLGQPSSISPSTLAALGASLYDLTTTDSKNGFYDAYGIKTTWTTDKTKLAIPLAVGPSVTAGNGCRVAVLGGPYGYKTVEWIVIRKKFEPDFPAVEESVDCQLMTAEIGALNDCLEPDNITTVYSRTGKYIYVLTSPVQPGVDIFDVPTATPVFANPSEDMEPDDFLAGMAPVDENDE